MMKITAFFTCLALGSASELLSRDLATVTTVVGTVDTNIKALAQAVQAFTSDATQVNSASQSLLESVKQGTITISATAELSLTDAISLQQTVSALQTDGEALVSGLAAKKAAFEQAGLCTVVFNTATELGIASKALIDAVVGKVPEAARGVAGNLVSGVISTLQKSADDFSQGNCINAGGSGKSGQDQSGQHGVIPGANTNPTCTTNQGAVIVSAGIPKPTATAIITASFAAIPFPQQTPPSLPGQGQCMCPCQCAATSVPTVTVQTRTSSVFVPPVPTPVPQNVTTSTPPRPVVTAGAASVGSSLGLAMLAVMVSALL